MLSICAFANICQRVACSQHFEEVLTACSLICCSVSAAGAPVVSTEGDHSLHAFTNSYQMMFFTLFALLAGTAIIIIGESSRFCRKCYVLGLFCLIMAIIFALVNVLIHSSCSFTFITLCNQSVPYKTGGVWFSPNVSISLKMSGCDHNLKHFILRLKYIYFLYLTSTKLSGYVF